MKHSKTILKCLQLDLQREKRKSMAKTIFEEKGTEIFKKYEDTKQQI